MSAFDTDVEREESVEDHKKRLEREHGELLQELRALIPGATVLFGFLLAISFTSAFGDIADTDRYVYYATLLCTAAALVLFLAPAAHHRVRFREGDKDHLLRKGILDAIAASVGSVLSYTGVLYLVTDLVFGTWQAIVASVAFFAFTAWRWWAIAVFRGLGDVRDS